ncbi:unnamed protein product [Allacma fusca]|uniref:Uncharacterized protein n=1 Tax=Allacma fusca TaxID=39272 RepID=A0A8J2P8M1_9HEXA|nr:unnamed protein product [Allacma fusca]
MHKWMGRHDHSHSHQEVRFQLKVKVQPDLPQQRHAHLQTLLNFLDKDVINCSDESFIDEALVSKLKLKKEKLTNQQSIEALEGKMVTTVTEAVQLELSSIYHPHVQYNITAFVIKRIVGRYPRQLLAPSNWNHIPSLGLADPHFHNPSGVNILLSTDIYYRVIRLGQQLGNNDEPVPEESLFCWLIGTVLGN